MRTTPARDEAERTERERGPLALEKLELLSLARLSVAGRRPLPEAPASRRLQPNFARRLSPGDIRESYARAIAAPSSCAPIDSTRLALLPAGRARLKRALRLATPPRARDCSEYRQRHLPHLLFDDTRSNERIDPRLTRHLSATCHFIARGASA